MWNNIETTDDLLNLKITADVAAELFPNCITEVKEQPQMNTDKLRVVHEKHERHEKRNRK